MTQNAISESQIFRAAVSLDPEHRSTYLDAACGGDQSLRAEVELLLRAHDPECSFLRSPAAVITTDQPVGEQIGTIIGRYKLLEQVGEGGMGVVYVAEQTEPVRRRVALKIIKPGMDTRQVIARFEAERQALAMMDHPNIARVLDAGTTEAGRPYFVMELVRGMPITEYCDKVRLSPRQRLELFVDVCQAVQHAHQKGIIHRDLKPSNVMVTMQDGRPVVKVIDFGVAKAVGQQLTERTVYTALTQLVGTPLYMSPEQAELTSHDVDTRSDIYSLGVLLYELLTGQTPFDKETLSKAGLDEMRRIIREDEPLRPSHRVSTLNAQASSTISQRRSLDERHLSRVLRGELDWIVMKALEKDRSRRYESASSLATDIQRYLSDEPVLACPPTTMYRFQKFARKHKPALATALAVALCLILGTTVSAWQAVRATTAEVEANANKQKAVASEQKAVASAVKAQEKEQEAIKERDEVKALNEKLAVKEQQLQRTLYAAHMNLAQRAWDTAAIGRVNELLDEHRPKAGETDLRGFEWHYLNRLCHPEMLTIKTAARGLGFDLEGKRLFTTSWNQSDRSRRELAVWEAQTGRQLFKLDGHRDWAISRVGNRVATLSEDDPCEIKVWDLGTGQELIAFKGPKKNKFGNDLAFSPDGKQLASAPDVNTVKIWDARTGQELHSLTSGHSGGNWNKWITYSPDGKLLAGAGGGQEGITVWDSQTGQLVVALKGRSEDVAFSSDGKRLASAAQKEGILVWDIPSGQRLHALKHKDSPWMYDVSFSPDGKRLASINHAEIAIWDAASGERVFTLEHGYQTISVAFSPDAKRLASCSHGRTAKIWDLETGKEIVEFTGHTSEVRTVAFSPDGTRLASGSPDGTVRIWDAQAKSAPPFSELSGNVRNFSLSPDGRRLAASTPDPATQLASIKVWDAQSGKELLSMKKPADVGNLRITAFSPNGNRLAAGFGTYDEKKQQYVSGEIKVWNAQTGAELATFKGHTLAVVGLEFSPDGSRLISCASKSSGWGSDDQGKPSEVKVWNVADGQELLALKGHQSYVESVAYSPDGKRLATLSRDDTLKVWDAETGAEQLSLPAQVTMTGRVVFSPDGKRIAASDNPHPHYSTSTLGHVKVWDAQTGQELATMHAHTTMTRHVVFSPDGKRLASVSGQPGGGAGRELKIWDVETGKELLTFDKQGGGGIAFTPDGHRLFAAGTEGIKVLDATPLPEKP